MSIKPVDILATLLLNLLQYGCTENILSCNETVWYTCHENQMCNSTKHQCECLKGFVKVGDECEKPDSESKEYGQLTVVTVTIFTLALLITGTILVIKKYHLIDYIHQKILARRNNDVMYEDVMIGNDDPPLSP